VFQHRKAQRTTSNLLQGRLIPQRRREERRLDSAAVIVDTGGGVAMMVEWMMRQMGMMKKGVFEEDAQS